MYAVAKCRLTASGRYLALAGLALVACSTEEALGPTPPLHPLPAQPIAHPQVAFVSNRDGPEYVYVANGDGSAVGRLALGWSPAWSWDGEKIAYVGGGSGGRLTGDRGIYVMNPDGSDQTQLTADGGSPAWSPDGRIAFGREGTDRGIFVMNGDGTNVTKLIDADFPVVPDDSQEGPPVGVWDPTWSPDGQTIAFMRAAPASYGQLYLANADGSGLRRFAEGLGLGSPAFSPHGSTLAFSYVFQLLPPLVPVSTGCAYPVFEAIATASPNATDPSQFEAWCGPGVFLPRNPGWSHHGTQLVFSEYSTVADAWDSYPTRERIYVLLMPDGRWQQLAPEAVAPARQIYDDSEPAWAPIAR